MKIILVSPLIRALQTAYLIFKHHLDFNRLKIIICPDLREQLASSQDIPDSIFETIEEYEELIPGLDVSLLTSVEDLWFLDSMSGDFKATYEKEKASQKDKSYKEVMLYMLGMSVKNKE